MRISEMRRREQSLAELHKMLKTFTKSSLDKSSKVWYNIKVAARKCDQQKVISSTVSWKLNNALQSTKPLKIQRNLELWEVRKDEKIDVSLTPLGYQKVEGIAKTILDSLKAQGGYAAVHDKSEPELIYSLFRCSKKAFKQAIGALYKQKIINIEPEGIRLIDKE